MSTNVHEKSNLSVSDISEMIKDAKLQQQEKAKKMNENKVQKTPTQQNVQVMDSNSNIDSFKHGTYVQTEDGSSGIIIDHEVEINKLRERDETGKKLMALLDQNSLVSDANEYKANYGEDAPENYDPGEEYIKNNPYEKKVRDMKKIKEGFAQLTFGLPGHGLVDINSEEGKQVSEALNKLRSGEIVLPTPEEYEAQKKAALERRKKRLLEKQKKDDALNQPVEDVSSQQDIVKEEPQEIKMAEMPDNAVMKKGVDVLLEQMNMPDDKLENPIIKEEQKVEVKSQTLNLAGLEEELNAEAHEEAQPKVEEPKEPEIEPNDVVEINVPAGEANDLIKNLPIETYDKVVAAKVVKVNEVELKDIPTKTTRITDVARYRMLTNRRPNTNTAEITERVLIESGFVVTLKSASSLELATIFKSPDSSDVDWENEYRFCYEHMVGSSIGKLSYNEFVNKVSPQDIESMIFGIYEISESDTRKVAIVCGTSDGGCGTPYEIDITINSLPDYNSLNDKTKERIKKIIEAKNDMDAAKRIADESSVTKVTCFKCGDDRIFKFRPTTGNMIISRMSAADSCRRMYGDFIAALLLYIESVTITYKEREDVEPVNFLIDTPELLVEELLKLKDEELEYIKNLLLQSKDDQYDNVGFSIKGPCTCPNCGAIKDSIKCNVADLVFQKVQSVLG